MRTSFVFYESFLHLLKAAKKKNRWFLFEALCAYAFHGELMPLAPEESALFEAMRPQIDANNRRYENGKRGGRPRNSANQSLTEGKPNENDNEYEKEKEKENGNVHANGHGNGHAHGLESLPFRDVMKIVALSQKTKRADPMRPSSADEFLERVRREIEKENGAGRNDP